MDENVKVSIVTPSYNQGQFIEKTIQSVINQTYKNIEYILIDGGSTDDTMKIIDKFRDKIDIVIHEKDKGQSDAINKGFRQCTGTLAGWINSDDILYPECIENLVNSYKVHPDKAIYYCPSLDVINADDEFLFTSRTDIKDKHHLLSKNYDVVQPTSFYNVEILKKVNYLDENIQYCMDLDLWLKLLDHGAIQPISSKSQGAFRHWEGAKTSTGVIQFLKEIRKTLRQNDAKWNNKLISKTYFHQLKYFLKRHAILLGIAKRKNV